MTVKNTFQENAIRVISVIGLIAVLLLGAWGIIQLAFFIPTFLSNIGGSLTPKTITTNTGAPKVATTTVQTPAVVAPVQEVQKPVVKKPAAKPAATYVASAKPRPALYGYPDLQVRMLGNQNAVYAGGQVSIQFVIENVGTNMVPANWFFTASLPYLPASQAGPQTYTYQSPVQQALYPGDKIVYTLGYVANSPYQYQYQNYPYYGQTSVVSIHADPYNLVYELNEGNNTASASYQVY